LVVPDTDPLTSHRTFRLETTSRRHCSGRQLRRNGLHHNLRLRHHETKGRAQWLAHSVSPDGGKDNNWPQHQSWRVHRQIGRRGGPETQSGGACVSRIGRLGILFRLIFVEERHALPHHDVHRIVAHMLRNRDNLEQRTSQPLDNPFGPRLSPMSQERSVAYVSGPDRWRKGCPPNYFNK